MRQGQAAKGSLWAVALVAGFFGCGTGDQLELRDFAAANLPALPVALEPSGGSLCVPGRQVACAASCPEAEAGSQRCGADGTPIGECLCAESLRTTNTQPAREAPHQPGAAAPGTVLPPNASCQQDADSEDNPLCSVPDDAEDGVGPEGPGCTLPCESDCPDSSRCKRSPDSPASNGANRCEPGAEPEGVDNCGAREGESSLQAPGAPGAPCLGDVDCGEGLVCSLATGACGEPASPATATCSGAEVCAPDAICDARAAACKPPAEDQRGTDAKAERALAPTRPLGPVGSACKVDTDCGGGQFCFVADLEGSGSGGPAGGYCTSHCESSADCHAVDPISECLEFPGSPTPLCAATCEVGVVGESKCLGREDLICRVLRAAPFDRCAPQCRGDSGCPGGVCDPSTGLCASASPPGAPLGSACSSAAECSGGLCRGNPGVCSAVCRLGTTACGSTERGEIGLCLRLQGRTVDGDAGVCSERCKVAADCTAPDATCYTGEGGSRFCGRSAR